MQNRTYRTEAIILKRQNVNEADRTLTVFSKHHGKIRCIAKGIRKSTSRKSGHLELFDRSKLFFARGKRLDIVTQAEIIERYPALRDNLKATKAAFHLVELIDLLTVEEQDSQLLYQELVSMFRLINQQKQAGKKQIADFEEKLLNELGFGVPKIIGKHNLHQHIEQIVEKKLRTIEIFNNV